MYLLKAVLYLMMCPPLIYAAFKCIDIFRHDITERTFKLINQSGMYARHKEDFDSLHFFIMSLSFFFGMLVLSCFYWTYSIAIS